MVVLMKEKLEGGRRARAYDDCYFNRAARERK
jgi:hypothetical protein